MPDFIVNLEADEQQLLTHVVAYYHETLLENADALTYLRERGITSAQAIKDFRIGFCDRSLGLKLPSKQLKAGKELRGRLLTLGIIRASGHEHFRGSLTFPVYAADGGKSWTSTVASGLAFTCAKALPSTCI